MTDRTMTTASEEEMADVRPLFEALYAHMERASGHAMLADDGFERWAKGYGRAVGKSRLVVLAREGDDPEGGTGGGTGGGRVVGFAEGVVRIPPAPAPPARVGHVSALYVDPNVRRGGLGRALHEALRAWFAERGTTEETVDTAAGNALAESFWAARGFVPAYTQHRIPHAPDRPDGPEETT